MRILVTGLNGFTGRYLKAELEAHGHTVIGLQADLTDPNAVATEIKDTAPQAVAHLAGVAFVGHGDANAFYQVNLIGTRNLLAALAQHTPDVSAVLLASSANVYGNQSEGVLNEGARPNPANDYAVSKLAMEHMARLWSDSLPLMITRPFNYTGLGQDTKFLIPKIVSHFREQKPVIELGNLDVSRDFGDVRAVCEAYRKLIEACPSGKTINVCSGLKHTLRSIIALCENITGHGIEVQVNPDFVRANEVRVLVGDNSRLHSLINNWQPYPLEQTLRWMLQSDGQNIK
ncbi:GDP-mannose 4,6 dehydratase [Gammaproteobacteria bacterium 50_400_T64]|nr:GDP-mannose 4,6 dehydratase [Gammaproteobacteria bacterium 50_400_T64]